MSVQGSWHRQYDQASYVKEYSSFYSEDGTRELGTNNAAVYFCDLVSSSSAVPVQAVFAQKVVLEVPLPLHEAAKPHPSLSQTLTALKQLAL